MSGMGAAAVIASGAERSAAIQPDSNKHNPVKLDCHVAPQAPLLAMTYPQPPFNQPQPCTISYLSSPYKKAFYLVGDTIRELSFLEAADIFYAEPSEKSVPFGDAEQLHYEQVRSALKQYTLDQQQEYQEDKLKIGSKDNDAKKAASFLREIRPMFDDEGRRTVDRLKQFVERGTYNQLADALNRISKKQKKEPAPLIKILEQLEELDKRYSQPQQQTSTKQVALTTADIILSETFKRTIL